MRCPHSIAGDPRTCSQCHLDGARRALAAAESALAVRDTEESRFLVAEASELVRRLTPRRVTVDGGRVLVDGVPADRALDPGTPQAELERSRRGARRSRRTRKPL